MLKYALLGAAMAMTAPALAQTAPATTPNDMTPAQTAPTTAAPATTPAPVGPTQQAPAAPADTMTPAPAAETAATAEPAPTAAEPAKEQVASVVDAEWGTYDADGNGQLSRTEFGTWMVALKSQSDPKTDANSPATKKWNQTAFTQADKDKSKSVSKEELAGFLAPATKS